MAWTKAKTAILLTACALLIGGIAALTLHRLSSPGGGIPAGWSVKTGKPDQWIWSGGKIKAHSTTFETILASSQIYRDLTLSTIATTTNREASLAFRMQDPNNGYLLIFAPKVTRNPYGNGFVALIKRTARQEQLIGFYNGKMFTSLGASAKLGVIARGSWLEVRMNDIPIIKVNDTTYSAGFVGLRIFGYGPYPCDATFSDLTISEKATSGPAVPMAD